MMVIYLGVGRLLGEERIIALKVGLLKRFAESESKETNRV